VVQHGIRRVGAGHVEAAVGELVAKLGHDRDHPLQGLVDEVQVILDADHGPDHDAGV
jgi:hypothetical protein